MIIDRFGRSIDILRISVTQECNMRCLYCHREGESRPGKMMSAGEIVRVVSCCARLGVRNVKITGGEPLMRDDILEIVSGISSVDGIDEVSMTTNGVLLEGMAPGLSRAGLTRINIGCDSFSSSVLEKTAEGIRPSVIAAKKAGLGPVKLNMVVLGGLNDGDIDKMTVFARETGAILQLIELVRTQDNGEFFNKYFFSLADVEGEVKKRAQSVEVRAMHNRRRYQVDGTVVEFVRPHDEGFCNKCRTIRVTSDGKIRPCLLRNDNLVDVDFTVSDDELVNRILFAVKRREPFFRAYNVEVSS